MKIITVLGFRLKQFCAANKKHVLTNDNNNHKKRTMYSTISAKLYFAAVVAILLTGQMSYCDNGTNIASNNTTKLNGSTQAQSSVVEPVKKSVEQQPVEVVIEQKVPQPIKNAAAPALAAPAAPAVADAPVSANVEVIASKFEIPGSIQTGFYIFVSFGLVVIFYISYQSYR